MTFQNWPRDNVAQAPHCLFHRNSTEVCYCFPPSLSGEEIQEELRRRYIERTQPSFVPICRAVFAPACDMQHWRNPKLTNKERTTFPYPGSPMRLPSTGRRECTPVLLNEKPPIVRRIPTGKQLIRDTIRAHVKRFRVQFRID